MNVTIRQAQSVHDRAVSCEIVRRAFALEEQPSLSIAARRLSSPRKAAADWWLLEEDGLAVASLLCYSLAFGLRDGRVVPGFGFGGVATLPEHRRRGHAERLCTEVAERCRAAGREIGLLFSAIPPAYYEKAGWQICPAWDQVTDRLREFRHGGARAELVPLDPRRSTAELSRLHASYHSGRLHLHRDEAAWQRSIAEDPEDWWLGVGDPDGRLSAYARVLRDGKVLDLLEVVTPDPADEAPVLRALAELALELGCKKMGSWQPPSPTVSEWFADAGREQHLPMVLGTDELEGSQFWSSDHF